MEYVSYVLIVLAILAVILLAVSLPGYNRLAHKPLDLSDRAYKHRARMASRERTRAGTKELQKRHEVLQRELLKVPKPWGWPGHDGFPSEGLSDAHHSSASLHRWIDRLTRAKRTVDDREYRSRKAASLRALLEDRYGRASRMPGVEYQKVRRPLLRDPSERHDQMDNFPSGKGDQIVAQLRRQSSASGVTLKNDKIRRVSGLGGVKTPWGW